MRMMIHLPIRMRSLLVRSTTSWQVNEYLSITSSPPSSKITLRMARSSMVFNEYPHRPPLPRHIHMRLVLRNPRSLSWVDVQLARYTASFPTRSTITRFRSACSTPTLRVSVFAVRSSSFPSEFFAAWHRDNVAVIFVELFLIRFEAFGRKQWTT